MRLRFMHAILNPALRVSVAPRLIESSQNQRRVLRPEGDTVANRLFYLVLAPNVGNVVEITIRIRTFEVYGGRNLGVMHGDERSRDSRSSAGSLRMPNLGFQS